jgi:hypothetical protein
MNDWLRSTEPVERWIEQERIWEQSVRRQNRETILKWVWLVMGVVIVVVLALVASTPR